MSVKFTTLNNLKLFTASDFCFLLQPLSISHIRLSRLRYFFITSYYIKSINNDKVTKTANNSYSIHLPKLPRCSNTKTYIIWIK